MINRVDGINMVNVFDNFFTIGVMGAVLIWRMMNVTGTGKLVYTCFSFCNK